MHLFIAQSSAKTDHVLVQRLGEQFSLDVLPQESQGALACSSGTPPSLLVLLADSDLDAVRDLLAKLPTGIDLAVTPYIVVTPLLAAEAMVELLAKGALDVICQPVNAEFLIAKIRNYGKLLAAQAELSQTRKELAEKNSKLEASEVVIDLYQHKLEVLVDARTLDLKLVQTQLSRILEAIPLPVLVVDSQGVCTHWNHAGEKTFGVSAKEFVGKSELWSTLYDVPLQLLAQQIATGKFSPEESIHGKDLIPIPDKELFCLEKFFPKIGKHLSVTVAPIRNTDGQIIGAVEVLADVTHSKEKESEAKRHRDEALAATESKSLFLANMSHEIRTPMNAIIGMTELCLSTTLDDRQKNYLEKIKLAGDSLLHIINDILDFSKIEAGKLTMESCAFVLEDVFEQLSAVSALRAENQGIELNYDIQCASRVLEGDPMRLGQVLTNLVSNALKFSVGGQVTVQVKENELADGNIELLFSVLDTGIGMTSDQIEHLFKPFMQAELATARKYGGTGLGLTISKHIVEQMGGKIWVESEQGSGSAFHFSTRFKSPRIDRRSGIALFAENLAAIADRPVLVVDDSPIARTILARMIRQLGLKVIDLESGEAAIEFLQTYSGPRLLAAIIDWRMPGINGIETTNRLRQVMGQAGAESIPIIMATAYSHHDELVRFEGTVDSVLAKPICARQLYVELAHCLKISAQKTIKTERRASPVLDWGRFGNLDVLVAEDIEINREVIGELLASVGINHRFAEDGENLLKAVAERRPDLILMDCQMPIMDGYMASSELRKDPAYAALPIIALTANSTVEDRNRCFAVGMNGYLVKPIRMFDLYRQLESVFPDALPLAGRGNARVVAPPDECLNGLELPGICVEVGLVHLGGKGQFYLKVLRKFRDTVLSGFEHRLQDAISLNDQVLMVRTVHSLKGTASTVGAMNLADLAMQLEGAMSSGDDAWRDALISKLLAELHVVLEGLAQIE